VVLLSRTVSGLSARYTSSLEAVAKTVEAAKVRKILALLL
jgi:hypothetical protein